MDSKTEHTPASTDDGAMKKRGPKPGTKYKKRITVPRVVRIVSDGQLVAAQRFNEQLDAVLGQIDNHIFPADHIDPVLIERLYDSAELVQSAVVDGIVDYHVRGANLSARPVAGPSGAAPALPAPEEDEQSHLPCRAHGPCVLGTMDEGG